MKVIHAEHRWHTYEPPPPQRPVREIAPFLAWASWGVVVAPLGCVAAMLFGGPVIRWVIARLML